MPDITKKFDRWFHRWGVLDEWMDSYHERLAARRIAWRAYLRGRKEGVAAGRKEALARGDEKGCRAG